MVDLWAALWLVAVLEGLPLFALPAAYRRMAEQMQQLSDRQLRMIGAAVLAVGLIALVGLRR